MSFNKLQGHDLQKRILRKAVRLNRISHSYLFHGIEGIGKKQAAVEFARLLNCLNKAENLEDDLYECSCISCSKIDKGIHPDVKLYEYPGVKNIKIDNIRNDIENQIFLSPYESRYKVFILDSAERMNTNAQNAFLKTLEEPPQQSVIILISSAEHRILPTILSRCQILNFTPLSQNDLKEYLTRYTELDSESAEIASRLSSGSLGKALRIDSEYLEFRKEIINSLATLENYQLGSVTEIVGMLDKKFGIDDIDSMREFFDLLTHWIRDLILIKINCGEKYLTFTDMTEQSEKFAGKRDTRSLIAKLNEVEKTWYEISRLNVNKKLALENMVIDIVS